MKLAQVKDKWWAVVSTEINIKFAEFLDSLRKS
jgi:hypothetical protein